MHPMPKMRENNIIGIVGVFIPPPPQFRPLQFKGRSTHLNLKKAKTFEKVHKNIKNKNNSKGKEGICL